MRDLVRSKCPPKEIKGKNFAKNLVKKPFSLTTNISDMWQTPTIKEDDGIPHNAMSHTQESEQAVASEAAAEVHH